MTGWRKCCGERERDALGQTDNIDRKFGNYFSAFVSGNSTGAGRKGKGVFVSEPEPEPEPETISAREV